MHHSFKKELRIARRKSGLANMDIAHLFSIDKSRVSRLEQGTQKPNLEEVCGYCIVHDRALHELFSRTYKVVTEKIRDRLQSMPSEPANWNAKREARLTSLELLRRRLEE